MNCLDKLEKKFGSLAIHNIAVYIVIGQVGIWLLSFGYVNSDGSNALLERMLFDSHRVLEGGAISDITRQHRVIIFNVVASSKLNHQSASL